jgi:hypothetical protein
MPANPSSEVQAVVSLCWKLEAVTTALETAEFVSVAWDAAIDILELFGRARPVDHFSFGCRDKLQAIWLVLIRNAAVSSSCL